MAKVLVTGGTGTLGSALAARLAARGHEVTALARRVPPEDERDPRATYVHGDVLRGEGVDEAAAGAEAIVHAVTPPMRRSLESEMAGTATVVSVARRTGAHLVYVSIVGVDRNPYPYYRAKLAAERVVERLGERWSIQRATQFHDLVDRFLGLAVTPVTPHLAFQPVDTGDLSERLARLVEEGPAGRAEDFGGPEVVAVGELAAERRRAGRTRSRLVPLPAVGFLRAFDRGEHLCPDHRAGRRTWREWLTD